nr:hypothetical protein [Streptomyces prasinopilosus]
MDRRLPGHAADRSEPWARRGEGADPADQNIRLLRPARKGEQQRPGVLPFKPLRQVIESVDETFKRRLDLEQHLGRTPGGVVVRVMHGLVHPVLGQFPCVDQGDPASVTTPS